MTATRKTYQFAIVPSCGCYGSDSRVRAVRVGDDLAKLQMAAEKMTRSYRAEMAKHGGSSGGYRVVEWQASRGYVLFGRDLDRLATA